jgi:hypothetical protein
MNNQPADYLIKLNPDLPTEIDLKNGNHLKKVIEIADELIANSNLLLELENLESQFSEDKDAWSLMIHLAIKLAKSKKSIQSLKENIHFSVVYAIYKEHNRILTEEEHPHGEDFVMRKIAQLEWLFEGKENFSWDMFIIDDGCPENSGKIAEQILKEKYKKENVNVFYLQNAINERIPVARNLKTTNDSRKGGSIEYGLYLASVEPREKHIIMYTDADLSIHLGQAGMLINSIIANEKDAAIGSRSETASIFIKQGIRNTRGKLFIYLWKRLIPQLNYIVDTQCGFKAFTAETVRKILPGTIEKQFAFDIELLLKTEIFRHLSIEKVAIAGIDSVEASTTTDLQPYPDMLKKMVLMYDKYLLEKPESDEFAEFIMELDEQKWNKLVDNVPEAIAQGNPAEFDKFNEVKVKDLKAALS